MWLLVVLLALFPASLSNAFEDPNLILVFGHSTPDTPADFALNRGIGLDQSTGELIVTDELLRRFDPNGVLLNEFSCQGCYGVDVNTVSHEIYAAVRFSNKIARYSLIGTLLGEFGSSGFGDGEFFNPVDVAVDSSTGEVYVIDGARVQVFDAVGNFLRKFGSFSGKNSIYKIAWDPAARTVWVADAPSDKIFSFTELGVPLGSFGDGPDRNLSTPGAIRWPRGIDIDENGNIHIADGDNERMSVFDPNGTFLEEYQGPYSLDPNVGPFHPRAVAVNRGNGRRYVSAGHAPRVDVFDPNNQLLLSIGDRQHNGDVLWDPKGIAVSQLNGDVFVVDSSNYLLKRFSSSGVFLNQTGGSILINAPQYGQPLIQGLFGLADAGIAIDSQGFPWTTMQTIHYPPDEFLDRLRRHDPNGVFVLGVQPTIDGDPVLRTRNYYGFEFGLAIDPATDYVYAADAHPSRNRIRIHDPVFGVAVDRILDVPHPGGLQVHGERLYVALTLEHKIRTYRLSDHALLDEWGSPGDGPGQFDLLDESGLTTDSVGNIYVADSGNHRVQVFAPNGSFLAEFGSLGADLDEFSLPRGVDVDRTTDQLYVLDTRNNRVKKYDLAMDSDSDTILDPVDNCPYAANTDQADDGGIGTGSGLDGIGNRCQCGDLNEDQVVDAADVSAFRQHLADPAGMPLSTSAQERCSVIGGRRNCTLVDVVALRRTLGALLQPGIEQVCSP